MVKKLILLGLGLTLLVGLPLAIFVLQNQTQTKSGAEAKTTFSFGVPQAPVAVGDKLDIPLFVDPQGVNAVSFVKVTFTYDGSKLDKASIPITLASGYTKLEDAQVTCNDSNICQGSFTLSAGNSTDLIIKNRTTIATLHLIAKANTDAGSPTKLVFVSGGNQALSTGLGDQAAENVFQSGVPGSITIGNQTSGGGGEGTPTPTPTSSGGGSGGSGGGSGGSGGSAGDVSVTCSSLTASPTSGNPPLPVTFTTVGNATNDSITKMTINYGDGLVDTVASGSGIGTGNVNAQTTHSYDRNGTFTTTATLTTSTGKVSNPASCSQTITVGNGAKGNLPPTGPGQTILLIGAAGAVLTIAGVLLIAGL